MAFNREVIIDVGKGGTGLRISNLDMSFKITRSLSISENEAQFTVYNMKEETRKKILEKDNNIICRVGYVDEGNTALIYSGTIFNVSTNYDNVDTVVTINAKGHGNNKDSLQTKNVKLSYMSNTPLSQIILDLANTLNIAINGIENVTIVRKNGFVYSGAIGGCINQISKILQAENINLYFDNSEMVIYNMGQKNSKFGVVNLNKNSGLIGDVSDITEQKDSDSVSEDVKNKKKDMSKKISFKSLLNPKLIPNAVVNIESKNIKGAFIIEKVIFSGDNFGGSEFYADCEALA